MVSHSLYDSFSIIWMWTVGDDNKIGVYMLTAKEKRTLIALQEKEKETYIPLTEKELEEAYIRQVEYAEKPIGYLQGFTEFCNAMGQWNSKVVYENLRLLQEIDYYRSELEKAKEQIKSKDKE